MVGSQISYEEEMFGRVFDKWVVRRFLRYLVPYRKRLYIAIASVLVYTLTQLSIPLIIRMAVDDALIADGGGRALLDMVVLLFAAVVTINYIANHTQETIVSKVAEHLLFDLRRAMYAHLQVVSLSFMDKTEVGRLMSRLQGDVYALQEFLEASIFAIGDLIGSGLAHTASHEGGVAAEVIAGHRVAFEPNAIPNVVYTDPEIAWCGLTEAEARDQGRAVEVARFPWSASGRATTLARNEGTTKLLIDPGTQRVLGVGITGVGAGDLISEGVLAVEMAALARDVQLTIHPHPTLSETVMEAAEAFYGQSPHLYSRSGK